MNDSGVFCCCVLVGFILVAVPPCFADDPDTLVEVTEVLGEFCEGYYDENQDYHDGFQCTGTHESTSELSCCGTFNDKYCCEPGIFINSLTIGKLIGILVGVFVAVLLCVIIACCCCSCCLCTGDRMYADRSQPYHDRRRSTRFMMSTAGGLRATLLRGRRKRRSPNAEASPAPSLTSSQQLPTPPPRHNRPAPTEPPYQPQPYPAPQQQYPLQQYPHYPSNYPPGYQQNANYPPQPYPHPVSRMVHQGSAYPTAEAAQLAFSAPPPPYTESVEHQRQPPPPLLLDKPTSYPRSTTAEQYPPPSACPTPPPSPRYPPPPPPSSPRFSDSASSPQHAPPLLDKPTVAPRQYPGVSYPPPTPSRRGPPSAPPEEDVSILPRKI